MSELRQRKSGGGGEAKASAGKKTPNAFADHAAKDPALQNESSKASSSQGLTAFGRLVLFAAFPFLVGTAGLYVGYLRSLYNPEKKIDFDNDFAFPFVIALTMVLVIGFQTSGFATKDIKPLVAWPKVRRKKKVVYKRVIVDDEDADNIKED